MGKLLQIPAKTFVGGMQRPMDASESTVADSARTCSLEHGDLIMLTGEMTRSRDDWQAELVGQGFVPWAEMTKEVKLVVAAAPDSL